MQQIPAGYLFDMGDVYVSLLLFQFVPRSRSPLYGAYIHWTITSPQKEYICVGPNEVDESRAC